MQEFPGTLHVNNKENFQEMNYQKRKCSFRKTIFEHMLSHKESEYFSFEENDLQIIKELVPELEELGWTCKLSFGDTGLFIYSGEKPSNCWTE